MTLVWLHSIPRTLRHFTLGFDISLFKLCLKSCYFLHIANCLASKPGDLRLFLRKFIFLCLQFLPNLAQISRLLFGNLPGFFEFSLDFFVFILKLGVLLRVALWRSC